MSVKTRAIDAGMRLMNVVHRILLAVSRGRLGWRVGRMAVVELHTVGGRTGRRRSTMLTAPVHGNGRFVLVASKGGDDRHPDWYLNLSANPDVELTIRGVTGRFRARTASAQERAELWPRIVAAYPGYAEYQRRSVREIPVIICEEESVPR